MVNEAVVKVIEDNFKFDYNFLDFFYPYTEVKGFDDVETDATDEEYEDLENKFSENILNSKKELDDLKYEIRLFIERRLERFARDMVKNENNT